MLFFSGTRTKENKLGYVADFCPTCHAIKPFQLIRIGLGDHIYFLSFGSSQVVGHQCICQDCKISINVNALCYSDINKTPGYDIETLINSTFPNIREFHAARLALAKLLHEGKLQSAERDVMLMDLWQGFAIHSDEKTGRGIQLGGRGGWGLIFTFIAALLLAMSSFWIHHSHHGTLFQAMGVVLVIGIIYSIIQMALDPGRISRDILAALAFRLIPFDTSREEIVTYLNRLKRAGYKLGKKINPDLLVSEIAKAKIPPQHRFQ